jgi:RNA polymerase sigma factor (sigma-70 family)
MNHALELSDSTIVTTAVGMQQGRDSSANPQTLSVYSELHFAVDRLPEIERKVVDLIWYHDLTQSEAARILNLSEQQVRRNWVSARLNLHQFLGDI